MKRDIYTFGKRAIAIASSFLILASTGCGSKAPADGKEADTAATDSSPAAESQVTESTDTQANADSKSSSQDITLTTYYYTSQKDGKEVSTGKYTDITFSDEIAAKYPKLAAAIDEMTSIWETSTSDSVGGNAYWYDPEFNEDMTFFDEMNVDILRFDDRMFTILASYSNFSGGAHPNSFANINNLDPVTGKVIVLSDVLTKPDEFPSIIRAWFEKNDPETLEEIDSFFFDEGEVFADKLEHNTYTYSVDENGLHILFSPYEVASYARGFIDCNFSYEEYPDLVLDAFKMDAPADMESRITRVDGPTTEVEAKEYFGFEYNNEESSDSAFSVANPSWKYYFNENYKKDTERHYVSLTETKVETTDWIDTSVWADDHGFNRIEFPYNDGTYKYEPYNGYPYDYMYNSIAISNLATGENIIDYDLFALCNGPDEKENRSAQMDEFIRHAKVVDDTLYVAISHWGYASEESSNAYIVAIDLNTNEVIFRSDPLVANGSNFQIIGDTIICGYGFTAEPDYIYLLDRFDGKTVDKVPVKSAPYQFEVVDDTLYVATYNTAYEFKINQ